jgi:hypothetical protein
MRPVQSGRQQVVFTQTPVEQAQMPPQLSAMSQLSSVQRGVLRQALVVSAPPGENGSFVCDTFVACIGDIIDPAHAAAAARLLHARASLADRLAAVICLHGGGQTRHTRLRTACQRVAKQ